MKVDEIESNGVNKGKLGWFNLIFVWYDDAEDKKLEN